MRKPSHTKDELLCILRDLEAIFGLYRSFLVTIKPLVDFGFSQLKLKAFVRKVNKGGAVAAQNVVFYQLFEPITSTYTYLIGDADSGECALIDTVIETVDRDLKLVRELGLKLKYVLDTHIHADHITGAGEIRTRTGAQTAVSRLAGVDCVDVKLEDGQELFLGNLPIRALATPGHTDSCMSFLFQERAFTGDALMIRGTGRTDFQQGSAERLYDSVTGKLFSLPPGTQVYPGHDYRGQTASTIALERKFNPRLGDGKSKADYVKIMSELKLADPKKIHEAVPANLACGTIKKGEAMQVQMVDGIPVIEPQAVTKIPADTMKIDVRRPDEFVGELGHVAGARLATLGPELMTYLGSLDKKSQIVFICRSGGRSGQATALARQMGFEQVANMTGGMLRWNELGLPVER